jgi:hypothetical protein
MRLKFFILFIFLTSYAFSAEKGHEGHNHAKGMQHIYYGEILSIDNAMGYKYLKVKENDKELWVAIANAPVKVGEKIGYDKNTIMKNFKSKSLKKIFKEIIFASNVYLAEKGTTTIKSLKDTLGLSAPKTTSNNLPKEKLTKPEKPFVEKEFYTVEEVFMWKDSLKDQHIKIKGQVLKVSKQIMKLDWVHIQDNTGSSSKRTDDLVFTTKNSSFKAGDKVIATGKVIINKDFGYGYFYKVIIEDSTFKEN